MSPPQEHFGDATVDFSPGIEVGGSVERGLNGIRLAVLGILVTIALSAAALVPYGWTSKLVVSTATLILAAGLIRWRLAQKQLMALMRWLTGI